MTNDINLDARKWRFLNNPKKYADSTAGNNSGLLVEPLERQFKTANEILSRFQDGRGVLLADDVGLGKTTVGALVAWIVACQGNRVRIYAPNPVMRGHWAMELERHVPMLKSLGGNYERINTSNILQVNRRPKAGQIQVTTHSEFINSTEKQTEWELMIIDEAHRAKGDASNFKNALCELGDRAKRKLILTATPFSIKLAELKQLLQFVGATQLDAVEAYAVKLKGLYELGDGHDVVAESERLVSAAMAAIQELKKHLIRHSIDDLTMEEKIHFGNIAEKPWEISTASASAEEIKLLLRMDRILHLSQERKGERRNDPRFHIGWEHMGTELKRVDHRTSEEHEHPVRQHIAEANDSLADRMRNTHPKVAAVIDAIRPVLNAGEKVLVFCHHRATAGELLHALEKEDSLKVEAQLPSGSTDEVWRKVWESVLSAENVWPEEQARPTNFDILIGPLIDWLCSPGLCSQIAGWLDGSPATTSKELVKQLSSTRVRNVASHVPTITESAQSLARSLLDKQSSSTLAVLRSITQKQVVFRGKKSSFPGRLDDGFRVMGSWVQNGPSDLPKTLYTGKPDIVIALFNSPFGPDVLVATDRLSEGVDLHRYCRHLIHYELDPSPVRTLQRNGRIRRVGSWAALVEKPICYAYPTFRGTRDEKAVSVMRQRINAFGLLLGGVPSLDDDSEESKQSFAEEVLSQATNRLKESNRLLTVAGNW